MQSRIRSAEIYRPISELSNDQSKSHISSIIVETETGFLLLLFCHVCLFYAEHFLFFFSSFFVLPKKKNKSLSISIAIGSLNEQRKRLHNTIRTPNASSKCRPAKRNSSTFFFFSFVSNSVGTLPVWVRAHCFATENWFSLSTPSCRRGQV